MDSPINLENINNITVSGRIASGATTLAKSLAETLNWKFWEGGELVGKFYSEQLKNNDEVDVNARPDSHEIWFEDQIKKMLTTGKYQVLQSHLAGFDAQNLDGVFKILVICEDKNEVDQTQIRIDRLVNRKGISIEEAKRNVIERERKNVEKWSRLYANSDPNWVYWDRKYYDLVINTYYLNQKESLEKVLQAIQYSK